MLLLLLLRSTPEDVHTHTQAGRPGTQGQAGPLPLMRVLIAHILYISLGH